MGQISRVRRTGLSASCLPASNLGLLHRNQTIPLTFILPIIGSYAANPTVAKRAPLPTTLPIEVIGLPYSEATYAGLKAISQAMPGMRRLGFALDLEQYFTYSGDPTTGDQGWSPI